VLNVGLAAVKVKPTGGSAHSKFSIDKQVTLYNTFMDFPCLPFHVHGCSW
jgi:hypothetical protein